MLEKFRGLFKKRVLAALLGIVLVFWILKSIDFSQFLEILSTVNPVFIFAIYPVMAIAILVKGLKVQQIVFGIKKKFPLLELSKLFVIGFFLGIITPGRLGDFSRGFLMRPRLSLVQGLTVVFIDRLLDVACLVILAILGLFAIREITSIALVSNEILIAIVLVIIAISFVFFNPKKIKPFLRMLLKRFVPARFSELLKSNFVAFEETIQTVLENKKYLAGAAALSLLAWVINFLSVFLVLQAFSISIPLFLLLALVPVIALVELIPIGVSGLGTREVSVILLFSLVGIPAEKAVAFSLTYFFTNFLTLGIVGFLLFLRLGKKI